MKNALLKMATFPAEFYLDTEEVQEEVTYADFRKLLGEAAWNKLVPAVRERFGSDHTQTQAVHYVGSMVEISCNIIGFLLAQICRLFGTPLTPYQGTNIPTRVHVYDDAMRKGTVWAREYCFPGKRPLLIRSTKCLDKDGLLESVDGGVRMRLRVYEEDGQLIFVSTNYFLEILGLRIPIPNLLTPGETTVIHTDLGGGDFRFTLIMEHPLFGRMFYQEGIFRLEEK